MRRPTWRDCPFVLRVSSHALAAGFEILAELGKNEHTILALAFGLLSPRGSPFKACNQAMVIVQDLGELATKGKALLFDSAVILGAAQ